MADVFVSYSRKNRDRVGLISGGLAQGGYSLWWDERLAASDDYAMLIESEITGKPATTAASLPSLYPTTSTEFVNTVIHYYRGEMARDFRRWRPLAVISVRLDAKRTREALLFEASGYARTARDARTGLPVSASSTRP